MANREAALRRSQNYTDRGQTPQRLQTLPWGRRRRLSFTNS